jgi:DNA-binding NarL/FixJ family response regulator
MLDELEEFTRRHQNQREYTNLRGKRILVVEDDPIVAVDYHFQMKDAGAMAQGFKATNEATLDYLASHEVDAAIVDYQLCDGTSERVMQWLQMHAIPFVVVSGCTFRMHEELDDVPVLSKPVAPGEICQALSAVIH